MPHVVLLVTNDPPSARVLRGVVESMGHLAWHVVSLDEARTAMAKGGSCAVVLDAAMGEDDAPRARANRGRSPLDELRAKDTRRNDAGSWVLPILVIVDEGQALEDLDSLYAAGAGAVVPKPLAPRRELLGRKLATLLRRAGREDHASCDVVAVAAPSRGVHLALTGERARQRTAFRVNSQPADLQNGHFVVLLRLGVAHVRRRGGWSARHQLGITQNPEIPSRIRAAFRGKVPPGYEVLEADWQRSFRLNPEMEVEIDLDALEEHPLAAVRKIVKEEKELRAQAKTGRKRSSP